MLTPAALDRASQGFRRGYRDGAEGRPLVNPYEAGSFAAFDYAEGHKAGENDAAWAARRSQGRA